MASNFGMPEFYLLQPTGGGNQFRVHDTRLIFICGDVLPSSVARNRGSGMWWRGRSALEGCYDSVVRYSSGLQWSERMLERKQQAVYSMVGLSEMIQAGMESLARTRIGMVGRGTRRAQYRRHRRRHRRWHQRHGGRQIRGA